MHPHFLKSHGNPESQETTNIIDKKEAEEMQQACHFLRNVKTLLEEPPSPVSHRTSEYLNKSTELKENLSFRETDTQENIHKSSRKYRQDLLQISTHNSGD